MSVDCCAARKSQNVRGVVAPCGAIDSSPFIYSVRVRAIALYDRVYAELISERMRNTKYIYVICNHLFLSRYKSKLIHSFDRPLAARTEQIAFQSSRRSESGYHGSHERANGQTGDGAIRQASAERQQLNHHGRGDADAGSEVLRKL